MNADLAGADFTGSNLVGTDLSGANLVDAIVSDAAPRAAVIRYDWLPNGQLCLLQQNCP